MHAAHLRLGVVAVAATFLAACSRDVTAPAATTNGVSARGAAAGGSGGGGGGASGGSFTGVIDSTANVPVGSYYISYQTVWYAGGHSFRALTTTKVHSGSDTPLVAGACAQFAYSVSGVTEYTTDIKVLLADKCGV